MSKQEEPIPEQFKISKDNDYCTIGSKKFAINRKISWKQMEKMTNEAGIIEEWSKNPDGMTIKSTMMEMARRSDKWTKEILDTFLIDFDDTALDEVSATRDTINVIAAQIFWSARTNVPFLAMQSEKQSDTDTAKSG